MAPQGAMGIPVTMKLILTPFTCKSKSWSLRACIMPHPSLSWTSGFEWFSFSWTTGLARSYWDSHQMDPEFEDL